MLVTKTKYSSRESEKVILKLVRKGRFTIRKNGNVYRNGTWLNGKMVNSTRILLTAGDDRFKTIAAAFKGKQYQARAHRIIWQWFNGDIPKGYCVWHINRDRKDNQLSNLKLVQGFSWSKTKPQTTRAQALEARRLYAEGDSMPSIAAQIGIRISLVETIIAGLAWRELETEVPINKKPNRGTMPRNWRTIRTLLELDSASWLLSKREYQIMKDRYINNLTLATIGEKHNLTRQGISHICQVAEKKLGI